MKQFFRFSQLALAISFSLTACVTPTESNTPETEASTAPSVVASVAPSDSETQTQDELTLKIKGDAALSGFSTQQTQEICLPELKTLETELTLPAPLSAEAMAALKAQGVTIEGNTLTFTSTLANIQTLIDGIEIKVPALPSGNIKAITHLKNGAGNTMGSFAYEFAIDSGAKNIGMNLKPAKAADSGSSCTALIPEVTGATLTSTAGGLLASLPKGPATPGDTPSTPPSSDPTNTETPASKVASIKFDDINRFLSKDGETRQLSASLYDAEGNKLSNTEGVIQWSSSRPQDISIDTQGLVKAQTGLGFSIITAIVAGTDIKTQVLVDVTDPSFFSSSSTPVQTNNNNNGNNNGGNNEVDQTPTLVSLAPNSGTINGGTQVIITGTNFSTTSADNKVKFGTTDAVVTASTATSITTSLPNGVALGAHNVSVTVAEQTSNTLPFTVTQPIGEFLVNTSFADDQEDPSVAMDNNGNYVIVWADDDNSEIRGQRYTANGAKAGAEFQISQSPAVAPANPENDNPWVDMNGTNGDFVVVWRSGNEDGGDEDTGIVARQFNADGTAKANEFRVNRNPKGGQEEVSVAVDNAGNFVIIWKSRHDANNGDPASDEEDIFMQRYNAAGTPLLGSPDGNIRVNTTTPDEQQDARIAMNDATGEFVVTWTTESATIHARRFDNAGAGIGNDFQVNTTAFGDSTRNPDIEMSPTGEFTIVWSGSTANVEDIYARRYNAAGIAQGNDFQINALAPGDPNDRTDPAIAYSNTGFVVSWTAANLDGDGDAISARRFDLTGTPLADEFQVNVITDSGQDDSCLAMSPTGEFVVVWTTEDDRTGDSNDIIGIRYNNAGVVQ